MTAPHFADMHGWGNDRRAPHGTHPVLIVVGGEQRALERFFGTVRRVEVVRSAYAMPYENDLPIFLARDPRVDFQTFWRAARHYN